MKAHRIAIAAGILLWLAGCNNGPLTTHKLVATSGEHTVPLYPDEATYLKVSHETQQGGMTGMIGSAKQSLSAKKIDDQTPVKIISTDSNGSEIQIVDGPMKGTSGFAAKQNVD